MEIAPRSVHMWPQILLTYFPLWIILSGVVFLPTCRGQKLKPNLTMDDKAVLLDENQFTPVTLTHLQCADPDGGVALVSADNVSPSKPCGKCFNVVPCKTDWCLDFTRIEELDMLKVNSYTVTIKCLAQNRQNVKDIIQEVILQRVTCIDPDKSAVKVDLAVDLKAKTGCIKCFSLEPCGTDWCLKFIPEVGPLSFSALPNYPMTLTCTDQEGLIVTSDIEVRVTKNSPPHFAKLFASTTITGTQHVKSGFNVFQANATDDEHDALYYTMKTTPDIPQLSIGFTDGLIVSNGDLSQVCTPVVSCEIMVHDGFNPEVGPMVLDLTLQDANSAPSITNMDETILVTEDTAMGSVVYKVHILDEDNINDMTLTLKANPPSVQGHFELKDDEIILKSAFNYEDAAMRTAQLTLGVKDSGGCSSATKTLTLHVTDVNEPPEMANEKISMVVYEGVISVRPQWSVQDEDFVDTKKYRIVKGNEDGRFAIDSATGVITSVVDYDVDRVRMPRSRTFTVEVEDKGGLTAQGEVTLTIKDANDNAPFILGGSRHFVVSECTVPGTNLTTLETEDYDSYFQFNSRVHLMPVRDGPVSLLSSGEIILTSMMVAGDTATLEAWAVDGGKYPGPLKSVAPVYLTVRCVPCPTFTPPISPITMAITPATPPPKTTNGFTHGTGQSSSSSRPTTHAGISVVPKKKKKPSDITDNLWWIVMAGLLGVGLMSLLGWLMWKVRCCQYCGSFCRRRQIRRSSKPPKLTKVRPHTPVEQRNEKETKVNLDLRRPPLTPHPPPKPPTLAPVLDIPPPETPEPTIVGSRQGHIYDFWKERYNEDDYTSQPDRNRKPEPTKDAVNPLDSCPRINGVASTSGASVYKPATNQNKWYNEEDYTSQPDRNRKPEPTKDAVNPLDPCPQTNGVVSTSGAAVYKPATNQNKCIIS